MAKVLDGDRMIKSVRLRTTLPDDTSIYNDDDILDVVDEEMTVQVLDKLVRLHGENLTISVDIPKNSDNVYDIPYRALGNKLRDVSLVSGQNIYELSQISIGELPDYTFDCDSYGDNDIFYMENNQVKLTSTNRNYESIRVRYYIRPNYLTKLEKAGTVSSVVIDENADTVTIGLSQVGKNFTSSDIYDIIQKKTPNKIRKFDLTPTSLTVGTNSGTIVFAYSDMSDVASTVVVGDYITIAEETPVPNIPTEMHPMLAQAAAVHILESQTDTEALRNAEKRLDKMVTAVQTLIDNRVELAPKKIKPRNGVLNSQQRGRKRDFYKGRG